MPADYKSKYLDMRAKLIESTDVAYRMGFEDGLKEGEMAAMQQQMQQQAAMEAQMAAQGGMVDPETGMPMGEAPMGEAPMGEAPMEEESPESAAMFDEGAPIPEGGTELDESIAELESLVSKGEKPKVTDLRKAVEQVLQIRKSQKEKLARRNEKVVSAQKQFVDNMLKSWEGEAKDATSKLEDAIKSHGITID